MRFGILTGGGDVPGLNLAIKAVVNRVVAAGSEIVGIRRGWTGLVHYNPDKREPQLECLQPLTSADVRTIDRSSGTMLHTSRVNPAHIQEQKLPEFLKEKYAFSPHGIADCTDHVLRVLDYLDIQALLVIGGDDTLRYALRLHREGFPIIAIPKTMDNDIFGTDYCIGFSTAINRSIALMNDLRIPAGAQERIAIVELFGRYSGESALIASYLGDVDRTLIPEVPFDPERLAALVMEDKRENPSNYALVVVAEGATIIGETPYLSAAEAAHEKQSLRGGIGHITGELLQQITGEDILHQQLGYLMRSGPPDVLDRMIAIGYGNLAAEIALRKEGGQLVALQSGTYTTVPLDTIEAGIRRVDVHQLYDPETYQPNVKHFVHRPMFL